jgi:SAM-dependent methyltransferase
MCGSSDAKVLGRRLSTSQGARPTKRVGVATTVMRCRSCGLVFSNPLPIPNDLGDHYDIDPGDYWRPGYFDETDLGPLAATFHSLWGGDRTPVALDVGAGIGKGMLELQSHGFDTYGLEPSPAFHRAAVERIDPERLSLASVEEADYPAMFDLVTFGAVLEHLPDPAGAIERALPWLAPGGLVQAEVPSSDWLTSRLVNLAYRVQGLDYVTNLSPMHPPFHLYEFTPRSFEAHAQRNGHTVALVEPMAGADTFLPGPDRLWRRLMLRTGTGMQLGVWLQITT